MYLAYEYIPWHQGLSEWEKIGWTALEGTAVSLAGGLVYLAYAYIPWEEGLSIWSKVEYSVLATAAVVLIIALEILGVVYFEAIIDWIVIYWSLIFIWIPLYVFITRIFTYSILDNSTFEEKPPVWGLGLVSSSGGILISVLTVAVYVWVEYYNEGNMPDMFNPASYEWTANYGNPVTPLIAFYSIGLVFTFVSFIHVNPYFKVAMPWITMPVLVPIVLLASFQSLYVFENGMYM